MGEEVRGVPEAPALGAAGEPGIGQYLASQRRLRGVSLDQLVSLTKIPRRSLERLEAGAFDASPDGFARGFVRTVADALGLDAAETVMRLMHEPPGDEGEGRAAAQEQRAMFARIAVLAGAVLAAVAIWGVLSALLASDPNPADRELRLRRDPIRDLAGEQEAREQTWPSTPRP